MAFRSTHMLNPKISRLVGSNGSFASSNAARAPGSEGGVAQAAVKARRALETSTRKVPAKIGLPRGSAAATISVRRILGNYNRFGE
jgi:hypothetical protein